MINLTKVETVLVPRFAVDRAYAHFREHGRQGFEGMALWVGKCAGDRFTVEECYVPRQEAVRTAHGLLWRVGSEELHRLNMWLYQNGCMIIAQLHSHPTDAYHSEMDDQYAIATKAGSLSLVIPNFAGAPFSLRTSAVYRLDAEGRWQELNCQDAERLIRIID